MLFSDILENISFFDDWEDRYSYIIELGKKLPDFPVEKVADYKVDGCVSQVWLFCKYEDGVLKFWGDSDAFIVKGLIGILLSLYDDKGCDEILTIDAEGAFRELGLESHLSPSRRNGFFSMVERIRGYASHYRQLPAS